ncbi:MAG TPA: IS110 family transposase [Bacteroidales bacterium]|nr:IS110 family transposase [Bacteroidales bacterium]
MKFKEFVGIDISKLKFDVRVLSTQKSSLLENNTNGFKKLISWLLKNVSCNKEEILIAMEHTGIYSLPISVFLSEKGYNFVLLPGLEIKRSLGIQRGKNDKIDAKRIAEYAYQKRDKIIPSRLPFENILKMRRLLALRDRLVRQRGSFLKDSKENLLFLKPKDNKVLLEVIEKSIKDQNKLIIKIEKELDSIIKSDELIKKQYYLIISIKGVGKQTALVMIAYTNCFTNFDTWRKFASYAGTAPFPYTSGTSVKGRNKVSHLANKKIKALLNLCAISAILYNPEMKIYYQNRKAKGANGMSTINIIRNKLIARIFAVVKRGTPYVETFKFAA